MEWPSCSPNLTPSDFFLWGYLKNKVFTTLPENINVLRQRIIEEFNVLRSSLHEMLRHVIDGCTSESFFVWKEMGDMLKGKAHSSHIYLIDSCYV